MFKLFLSAMISVLVLASSSSAQEDNARDGFVDTRKTTEELDQNYGKRTNAGAAASSPTVAAPSAAPTTAPATAPAPATGRAASRRPINRGRPAVSRNRPAPARRSSRPAPLPPTYQMEPAVGLGYTLFLKNAADEYARVSPNRIFLTGQMLRLLIETNQDGYIYIFHQENDQKAKMLFPDSRVSDGDNFIRAHHSTFVPARYGFVFKGGAAIETFTLVFSRTPLAGLPFGAELRGRERVLVPDAVLQQVLEKPCVCRDDKREREGELLTEKEGRRDVELGVDDPEPDRIILNQNRNDALIVTRLRLTHR